MRAHSSLADSSDCRSRINSVELRNYGQKDAQAARAEGRLPTPRSLPWLRNPLVRLRFQRCQHLGRKLAFGQKPDNVCELCNR